MKKFLFDLFPVIVFFVVFNLANRDSATSQSIVEHYLGFLIFDGKVPDSVAPVLLATAVSILATMLQVAFLLLRGKKVDGMLWLSFFIISVMGGLTIYFHNENFIKWKPTILYWAFASALFIGQLVLKRNLIRSLLEAQMSLPEPVWNKIGLAWAIFFAVMGCINLYVAFNFTTATWVNFKLFGGTILMFIFVIGQSLYLSKYLEQEK